MNSDTGLIYLRARSYDPATAQFINVDPALETTHAPYTYALDSPLGNGDPTGLTPWSPKVKQAVTKCRSWKAWHSKKSPYYGNKNIYSACQDLLRLPPEVFGTNPNERHGRSSGSRVLEGVVGAAAVASGVITWGICTAATDGVGSAHCVAAVAGQITAGGLLLQDATHEL
jgi:hypothetical protein